MRWPFGAELAVATAIAAGFAMWSRTTQQPASVVVWDAGQYYAVSTQLASGLTPTAEAPYVYRLGIPWLASRLSPADPLRGFFLVNVACGIALAPLLAWWLSTGVRSAAVRLGLVALYAAAWHGPVRYVPYNAGYVDPPFMVCVVLGLLIMHSPARPGAWQLAALTLLSIAGSLVRETMLLVPVSALWAGSQLQGRAGMVSWRPRWWPALVPAAACAVSIAATHAVVVADTTRSFVRAAAQWVQKPPSSYLLAWFTAYGPVLAVLVFDWRAAWRDLLDRPAALAFLALCAVLAFFGGSDTERFVFWAMPVVYLLIGRAIERQVAVLRAPALVVALVLAQLVSARVPWTIPDTQIDPAPLAEGAGWAARIYGVLDRLFVIEHFHWNLWSSFGSAPFRLLRLALYLVTTVLLVWAMARRAREARVA